jgi:hypothetical protein
MKILLRNSILTLLLPIGASVVAFAKPVPPPPPPAPCPAYDPSCKPKPAAAPEVDPSLAVAGIALLGGALTALRARRK